MAYLGRHDIQHNDTQHNRLIRDTQHYDTRHTSVECCCAECRYYLNVMLSVFMLYVVRLSVVAPILQSLRQIFELMAINCYFHGNLKAVKP